MIRLESYGDRLKKDDYRCHSRFKRAVNFFNGRSMVALVDRQIGPGPHHIVVSGIDPRPIERLAIGADELRLDGIRIPFTSACRYDSKIDLDADVDQQRFAANLEHFAHDLRHATKPKSLTFLLEPKPEPRRRSALEKSIAARLGAGSTMIFGPDFLAGIKMVKGLGFGLTPGGDDLIGGILLALHSGQIIFRRDFSPAIRAAAMRAAGKNPFSNMLFIHASTGRAIGKIKDLLAALVTGDEKSIRRCTARLKTIGHSSGIDFGIGMLLAFKKLVRTQGAPWW